MVSAFLPSFPETTSKTSLASYSGLSSIGDGISIESNDGTSQAVCGVSRAALMTGSYPIRVGDPVNVKQFRC